MTMRRIATLLLLSTAVLFVPATASAAPALSAKLTSPTSIDDALRGQWRVTLANSSATAFDDLPFEVSFYSSSGTAPIATLPDGAACAEFYPGQARCTVDVPANATLELPFTVQYRTRFGHFSGRVESTSPPDGVPLSDAQEAVLGHPYTVRTADDAGEGSLRQAILDVNRECTPFEPCMIGFAIEGPVPAEGWFTIKPQSPLPAFTGGDIYLDGRTQTQHTGDTNPLGPEIALDGTDLPQGMTRLHGLSAIAGQLRCDSLAIGGFPGNGIQSSAFMLTVRDSYLGVDATGRHAMPNSRGVQVSGSEVTILNSVLSANRRAGGYFVSNQRVTVQDSYIGVGADGVTPLGNGASGLFFHKTAVGYNTGTATGNVIANNGQAGIALSMQAVGNFAQNSFHDNGGSAIDVGIDGPTAGRDGLPGQGGVIAAPVILAAHYENGITTITADVAPGHHGTHVFTEVNFYASSAPDADGTVEGAEWLGRVATFPGPIELEVNRDLRGRLVNASAYGGYVYGWDDPAPGTSELGSAKVVD